MNANMQREELDGQFAFLTADFEELLASLDASKNGGKVIKKGIVSNCDNSLAHNLISPSPLSLSPSPLTQQHQSTEVIRARSNSAPFFQCFKKYACQICEKRFKRPSSLSTHMNIHTGQKPHLCPFSSCGKPFNAKSNMLRHYKIHFKIASGEYLLPSGEVTSAKPASRQLLLDPESQFTAQPSPNYKRDSNFERRSF